MRSFDLGQTFGPVLISSHSFQNIVTAADQVGCLESIRRHLAPGGILIVHLDYPDVEWLGSLRRGKGGVFETAPFLLKWNICWPYLVMWSRPFMAISYANR